MSSSRLATTPVVILAGGLGTRLRSVVADRPKALAPVGAEPFLEIQIKLLARQGARRFVLCVGHLSQQLIDHFGDGRKLGVAIEYSIERDTLLGTAGALKLAQRFFAPDALVLNGDTYLALDFNGVLEHHARRRAAAGAVATLVVAPVSDAQRFGTVLLDAATERLVAFREKQAAAAAEPGWVSAGVYVLHHSVLQGVPDGVPCSLEREVFPQLLAGGKTLAALVSQDTFYDIGTPDSLRAFDDYYGRVCGAAAAPAARCD